MKNKLKYINPDFRSEKFRNSSDAEFAPAPADKILPEGFYSTSNFPTYVKVAGKWILPKDPRMDSVVIKEKSGELYIREMCNIGKGDLVAVTKHEDGSDGLYVHSSCFATEAKSADAFRFMKTEVSREKPIDYDGLADLVYNNKNGAGYSIWVIGPAVIHAKARDLMSWCIENDYIGALFAGNAVAVHDIEEELYGTTLGSDSSGIPTSKGHSAHMKAINEVKKAGSIENLVSAGKLRGGIMYSCTKKCTPYVLAGSIRDDGPLPETITNILDAQIAMRMHTKKATLVVMIATALHSIATGNMLPAYIEKDEEILPVSTICVDQTEFVPNKLKDRGTHQAYGVVANAQDFLFRIKTGLENKYLKK